MSKRPFKTQASSSRAISSTARAGFGGSEAFGAFGDPVQRSVLSYLTEPPDLYSINDANVVVALKSLSKKDDTTKAKALEELRAHVQSRSTEAEPGVEDALIEAWVTFYPRLSIDNARRVRELAHSVLHDLVLSVRKRIERHIPQLVGSWLGGTFDRDRAVARAASEGLRYLLDTPEKYAAFWKKCQPHILTYALDAMKETPQTLSDERLTSAEDASAKYFRVANASLCLIMGCYRLIEKSDRQRYGDKYEEFALAKVWDLCSSADPTLRRATCQYMDICLGNEPAIISANLEAISHAFIAEGLRTLQSGSTLAFVKALNGLTHAHPQIWTSAYKGKKSVLSRLRQFVERGSQGASPEYWTEMTRLFEKLPGEVLQIEAESLQDILTAYRKGMNQREEPRQNATEAWTSYTQLASFLPRRDPSLLRQSVYPILEQWLIPDSNATQWNVPSLQIVVRACRVCQDVSEIEHQQFDGHIISLAEKLVQCVSLSSPEQSKDYQKSQAAVSLQGQRWFSLVSALTTSDEKDGPWLKGSHTILESSIRLLVSRLGKPYSAASILESSLNLSPSIYEIDPEFRRLLQDFYENDFIQLLTTPASEYLVSSLWLSASILGLTAIYTCWNRAAETTLSFKDADAQARLLTGLLNDGRIAHKAREHQRLQQYMLDSARAFVQESAEVHRPTLNIALTHDLLSPETRRVMLEALIHDLQMPANDALDRALRLLQLVADVRSEIIRDDHELQVMLLTRLLSLMELSDGRISFKVVALKDALERPTASGIDAGDEAAAMLQVLRRNLDETGNQSLPVGTMIRQANGIIESSGDRGTVCAQLLPSSGQWRQALLESLSAAPDTSLGVLRPFAGAVFLVRSSDAVQAVSPVRDSTGYTTSLRMAMYTTGVLKMHFREFSTEGIFDALRYVLLTRSLVEEQLDMAVGDGLFLLDDEGGALDAVQIWAPGDCDELLRQIAQAAPQWYDFSQAESKSHAKDLSHTVAMLLKDLIERCKTKSNEAYRSARSLSRLLTILSEEHGWTSYHEEWLSEQELLIPSTSNVLATIAVLSALQDRLQSSKKVSDLCNHLISAVASATVNSASTLQLLVILNSVLDVFDHEDALPVAQNRLVFAVKQLCSWTKDLVYQDIQLCAETSRALTRLLPAIKDIYGSYWENAVEFSVNIWNSGSFPTWIPSIGMSLQLVHTLQRLDPPNDDLAEALQTHDEAVSTALLRLMTLPRDRATRPMQFVDAKLCRMVCKIPLAHIKDLHELYPLLASDARDVQSTAFEVLHRVVPSMQQQLSVDVLLEKRDAHLPDELISLLLEPPILDNFTEEALASFPSSIRSYLLTWHVIFDAFPSASFKVRADYTDDLKRGNHVDALLTFMFDVLGHSIGSAVNLEKAGIQADQIREYDIRLAGGNHSPEWDMQLLLVHLYYSCLQHTPNFVKTWWMECKSKQTRMAVEAWTEKYFSPLVIDDTIAAVQTWADEQETSSEEEKELIVKTSKRSREVFAGMEIDDTQMRIVIRLPATYPLAGVEVEGLNRVAVSEKKWNSWMMITKGVISFSNGSITDGLTTFRKNVTGALKGQTECAICYSIISSDRKIPDKRCQTCRNLFHSDCLFKWFASSNQSTCPLCRNPFNYGSDAKRR